MYTVSKGPSKLVAKTRRGIAHSQNIERLESLRDQLTKKSPESEDEPVINGPKPVFSTKKPSLRGKQERITPEHAEMINFVYESWERICQEYEESLSKSSEHGTPPSVIYYDAGEPNNTLKDFKPFDLESWWGKRLFNNITKSI